MNLRKKLTLITCVVGLSVGNCYAKNERGAKVLMGDFDTLESYKVVHGDVTITGKAHVVCNKNKTVAVVEVEGLDLTPLMFPTHLHADSCDNNGGGHYKIIPIGGTVPSNEIWPVVMNNEDGTGSGKAKSEDSTACDEDGAMSIVIHDPNNGGAKMLCADLE